MILWFYVGRHLPFPCNAHTLQVNSMHVCCALLGIGHCLFLVQSHWGVIWNGSTNPCSVWCMRGYVLVKLPNVGTGTAATRASEIRPTFISWDQLSPQTHLSGYKAFTQNVKEYLMTKGFSISVLDKWWSSSNSARNLWKEEPLPQARIKSSRYTLLSLTVSSLLLLGSMGCCIKARLLKVVIVTVTFLNIRFSARAVHAFGHGCVVLQGLRSEACRWC